MEQFNQSIWGALIRRNLWNYYRPNLHGGARAEPLVMHQLPQVFIADPGQIEVLTDSFGRGGSGGYSTDLDRPANRSHPQFAGCELDLPANGEVDAPNGQTQPLLGVRALGWVIQENREALGTVVFALLVLLLITSS